MTEADPAAPEPGVAVAPSGPRAGGLSGPLRRLGESALATWTVAGILIALVASVAPADQAVRAAPWVMGPALWVVTALGSGLVLRTLAGWTLSWPALGAATVLGGAADALVVAGGRPWIGLIAGVSVYVCVIAALGRSPGGGGWATPSAAGRLENLDRLPAESSSRICCRRGRSRCCCGLSALARR